MIILLIIISYLSLIQNDAIDYSPSSPIWTNNQCQTGRNQSPIDLPLDVSKYLYSTEIALVETNYSLIENPTIKAVNNGEKFSFQSNNLGYILFKYHNYTYKYNAFEISFHSPSEHTLSGFNAPLELQINHTKDLSYSNSTNDNIEDDNADNTYLVISVFLLNKEKYTSEFIRSFTNFRNSSEEQFHSPYEGEPTYKVMNLNDIVLSYKMFFYYQGSMTIPPCKEGVHWLIQNHFKYFSSEQFSILQDLIKKYYDPEEGNRRVIQSNSNVDSGNIYALYNNTISINIMFSKSSFIKNNIINILFVAIILCN